MPLLRAQVLAQEAAATKADPEINLSHFIDTIEPTRTLPRGSALGSLEHLLHPKVRLRKDTPPGALSKKHVSAELFAIEKLYAGRPVLLSQVARWKPDEPPPSELQSLMPPGRVLRTVLAGQQHSRTAALCSPYEPVRVAGVLPALHKTPVAKEITDDARLLDSEVEYESTSEQSALFALALTPEAARRWNELEKIGFAYLRFECSALDKYEQPTREEHASEDID